LFFQHSLHVIKDAILRNLYLSSRIILALRLFFYDFWKRLHILIVRRAAVEPGIHIEAAIGHLARFLWYRILCYRPLMNKRTSVLGAPIQWEQRFADTAEMLPCVVCEIDPSFRFAYVNKLGLEIFGYDKSDFEDGVFINDLVHADSAEQGFANFSRVLKGEFLPPHEYKLVHKDGTVGQYQVNSSPILENHKVVGIRTCVFDIGDRKRAEHNLRESEKRFRQVFFESPTGVALFAGSGKALDINESLGLLFGITKRSQLPNIFDIVPVITKQKKNLADGQVVNGEGDFEFAKLKGKAKKRYCEWSITPLPWGDNRAATLLLQLHDITERRQAEQARLREANKAAQQAAKLADSLRREVCRTFTFENMIGRSHEMQKIFDVLPEMAKATTTVLVQGDSGTGKELIAKALHALSGRKTKPFVAINCSALPDNLLESELFGYKAGAFTDAKKDKPGKFAMADGGVILLDEIGDISAAMQVKLLRVLQERTFEPLGGTNSVKTDVRVIAATNKDLKTLVSTGQFREDLFYRLNILKISLPTLNKRRSDIPLLTDHFIKIFNQRFSKDIEGITTEAMDKLLRHDFRGNIRELENIIEHAFVFCKEPQVALHHLPEELSDKADAPSRQSLKSFSNLEEMEAHFLRAILEETGGNKVEAAKRLGIHKSTLFRKLKKLGISS
jgi:PAS domain S-box-containing protein